jgi:hypothetical protein
MDGTLFNLHSETQTVMNIQNIPINAISITPNNPRTITDHGFKTLVASIQEHGFNQPVVLNKDLTIIDGNQRVRVMDHLDHKTIPAIVIDVDQDTAIKMNIQFNNVGGRNDMDVLANHFDPEFLFTCGFDHWELGLVKEHENDDPDQDNKPAKKYRFTISCDTLDQIRDLKVHFDTNGRRVTFAVWNERTFGKTDDTGSDDDDDGGFGGGI